MATLSCKGDQDIKSLDKWVVLSPYPQGISISKTKTWRIKDGQQLAVFATPPHEIIYVVFCFYSQYLI